MSERVYGGKQRAEWIYQHGARTLEEMTNLPEKVQAALSRKYEIGRSETVVV